MDQLKKLGLGQNLASKPDKTSNKRPRPSPPRSPTRRSTRIPAIRKTPPELSTEKLAFLKKRGTPRLSIKNMGERNTYHEECPGYRKEFGTLRCWWCGVGDDKRKVNKSIAPAKIPNNPLLKECPTKRSYRETYIGEPSSFKPFMLGMIAAQNTNPSILEEQRAAAAEMLSAYNT